MSTELMETQLEELTGFLYVVPVGLMTFTMDGTVRLANPLVAQLLMPLTPGGDLLNAYVALAPLMPDLARRVHDFSATYGVLVDHQRCTAVFGRRQAVLSITVHRIHGGVNLAVIEDVTRLVEQERRLYGDQQRFQAIFDNVRDYAIYIVDLQGKVEEWNQSLQRFGGWRPEDVVGRPFGIFFSPAEQDAARGTTLLANAQQTGSVETEGWQIRRDGARIWTNSVVTALPDSDGSIRGFVVVSRDMSRRKTMEDELRRLATTDPLTGAFNRRHGQATLADAFQANAQRAVDGNAEQPGVLTLDIDHFKAINDRHGHDAGDAALCATVDACHSVLGERGSLVRWGGEEFLIILPSTCPSAATEAAEDLRAAIADVRVPVGDGAFRMTASIGVAVAGCGDNPESLIRRADTALYAAKHGGRNRVVVGN